jgi:tRNA (guanine37-N1)-methyltransferase
MRIDCITLFPELIQAAASAGIVGRAHERALVQTQTWNPRDYAVGNYRRVDDRTAGGGAGMVMMLEPLRQCLQAVKVEAAEVTSHVVYFSPQGKPLTQARVRELAAMPHLVLICGRYEGVDERFIANAVDEEISLGDFVLSGGELPAAVLIDAVTRVQEGAMSDMDSARLDSFEDGLLDHPHFTKPNSDEWGDIPAVLLGGNHAQIAQWRRQQQLQRTFERRPDLLESAPLSPADRQFLDRLRAQTDKTK